MPSKTQQTDLDELRRRNRELRAVIEMLLQRSDELFASRSWKLGRIAARIERPFRKLFLGDRSRYRHLEPSYFHDPVTSCEAFWRPFSGRFDDVPTRVVAADARQVLNDLWSATDEKHAPDA